MQESDIIFSKSRIEYTRQSSTIKARFLSIPRRPSEVLFFNFCSEQQFANQNSVTVRKKSATFSWSNYQMLWLRWGRLSWPDKPRVHVQIDRSSILKNDFELKCSSGSHTILNQLFCSLVCVWICLFPQIRRFFIIFCVKIKRSPWHLSRTIPNYPANYPES